jgi:hypothetical protein
MPKSCGQFKITIMRQIPSKISQMSHFPNYLLAASVKLTRMAISHLFMKFKFVY